MPATRTGIWFIGARGNVATTTSLGLSLLREGAMSTTGLVTALPAFEKLDLVGWDELVVGGHEIRSGSLRDSATALAQQFGGFESGLLERAAPTLDEIESRIVSGTFANCGPAVEALADGPARESATRTPRETVAALQQDLKNFQSETGAERVIVVNLASTEPVSQAADLPATWDALEPLLDATPPVALPASCLYALAALDLGLPYINFTPSLGATPPAIGQLAELRGTCHAGRDGKTGETLLKSALAPMFAARNLQVMSWVGHNIFGNLDGRVLDDPLHKSAKIRSKDQVLGQIFGYEPQTHVSIEYIESLGDWKTAWDHVHFRGFLSVPMTMQFTWQGCDSILAAPLVIDLVRLVDLAARRGERGTLAYLASFFKSPLGTSEHDFFRQVNLLGEWVAEAVGEQV